MSGPPTKAGEITPTQSTIYMRVIDPNDTSKIVQIGMTDTGNTLPDGTKIYNIDVSGSTLTAIAAAVKKPNARTGGTIVTDGTLQSLPTTTDALVVLLTADPDNTENILLWNNTPIEPGVGIVIETEADAAWIQVQSATNGHILYYEILRYAAP